MITLFKNNQVQNVGLHLQKAFISLSLLKAQLLLYYLDVTDSLPHSVIHGTYLRCLWVDLEFLTRKAFMMVSWHILMCLEWWG